MAKLDVTLLGTFGLTAPDGRPIRVDARKARALLAILLMARGRPVTRERLAGMLWSRGESRQALASLSQALYNLRRAIEPVLPDLVESGVETVRIDTSQVNVDAIELEEAADDNAWAKCIEKYRGPFLDDVAVHTEEAFSDWRTGEQARLDDLAARAATALLEQDEANEADSDNAVIDCLLSIEPYSEVAIRARLRKLAGHGRPAAALETAEIFASRLSDDLGLEPSMETTALIKTIRRGELKTSISTSDGLAEINRTKHRLAFGVTVSVLIIACAAWLVLFQNPNPDADEMRLLVRPFVAGSGVGQRMAEGFGDDLSTELVRRATLQILSRESGRLIPKGAESNSGATHLMSGRLRQEDDQYILNIWITDLNSGREIWANRIAGSAEDLRSFRDHVVSQVADRIDQSLLKPPDAPQKTLPAEAVASYLRGISLLHAATPEANAEAIGHFSQLQKTYPEAREPAAALAVAYDRVAFGSDDHARAARLHWLEGYLHLKVVLASAEDSDPDILAARARLALRRLDYEEARTLALRAIELEASHVAALGVLAEALALDGQAAEAKDYAERVIALSPAAPELGYLSLALARFSEGDLPAAREAANAALEFSRFPPPRLLVLLAAIEGASSDASGSENSGAFSKFVEAMEGLPFGAWRLGRIEYENPRAATWRRPSADDAASLIQFTHPKVQARFRAALVHADPNTDANISLVQPLTLSGEEIDAILFGAEISGPASWLIQRSWSQVRTDDGDLFQNDPFGPLPIADEGKSRIFENRLCDTWEWDGVPIESCQLVIRLGPKKFALMGEVGTFEFSVVE